MLRQVKFKREREKKKVGSIKKIIMINVFLTSSNTTVE
jgi:hypothetical protein